MAKKFDAKAKAKRQKIILAVLGVVFLGVLAWQVPSVLKMMNKKPPAAATTPPPAAAPAPALGTPVTPVSGTPVSATTPGGGLTDSDPAAQAASGQLVTFDRFASKDPFQQQALLPDSTPTAATETSVEPPTGSSTSTSSTKPPPPPPAPAPTTAQIAVNGSSETVAKGGTFPQSDPVFVLLSVSKTTAKVAISGGSLASGGATVTLKRGKKLTLENTVDGARYVLLLVSTG
jgi:hypothetical protein